MGKVYNISFDSTLSYSGANNNKRSYVTDWASFLPDNTPFRVTFSFSGADITMVNNEVMTLHMDIGQTCSYAAGTSQTSSTRYLGILIVNGSGVAGNYYATHTTNPPVYIRKRPSSNVTEVELHQGLTSTNFNNPVPGNYVLTLAFEEL